jgi:hypothetical protein
MNSLPSPPVLLYTSFGPGPHVDEVLFSIPSAVFKRKSADDFRIVIFTDDPLPFESTPAEIVVIDQKQSDEWAGPHNYVYRRKICGFAHALRQYNAPVAMIDGDTYFLAPPEDLFGRIAPGKTLMHCPEGRIGYLVALGFARHELAKAHVTTTTDDLRLTTEWMMWNSGVVGVHPADVALVDRSIALNDAVQQATGIRVSEQIAFTHVLSNNSQLQPARDLVFHYHEGFMRKPFRAKLPELLAHAATIPSAQQPAWLYSHRPKPPLKKKLSATIKRPLKRLGLFKTDLNTST